jgi:hypothetical protein
MKTGLSIGGVLCGLLLMLGISQIKAMNNPTQPAPPEVGLVPEGGSARRESGPEAKGDDAHAGGAT